MDQSFKFEDGRCLSVGCMVVYTDEVFQDHNALVTAIWGDPDNPRTCINLLWVSGDESKQDQYGRQIERATSISYHTQHTAGGFCWRFPDEPKPERGTVIS